jgi:hypothetical protein
MYMPLIARAITSCWISHLLEQQGEGIEVNLLPSARSQVPNGIVVFPSTCLKIVDSPG